MTPAHTLRRRPAADCTAAAAPARIDDARSASRWPFSHHHLDGCGAFSFTERLSRRHFGVPTADRPRTGCGLEIAKAPFQHLLGSVARSSGSSAVDDDDQPCVVCTAEPTIACALLGVAVFRPSGAGERVQQRVAVLLAGSCPGEFLLPESACTCRIGLDHVPRQSRQFPPVILLRDRATPLELPNVDLVRPTRGRAWS